MTYNELPVPISCDSEWEKIDSVREWNIEGGGSALRTDPIELLLVAYGPGRVSAFTPPVHPRMVFTSFFRKGILVCSGTF